MRDTGWFKSTHSGGNDEGCVEVRLTETGTTVRDSKNPTGPTFHIPPPPWQTFLTTTRESRSQT